MDESAATALSPLLAVSIVFLILTPLFVSARFFTAIFLRRTKNARALWWDDWLVIPAIVAFIGMASASLAMRSVFINANPTVSGNELVNPELNILMYPTFRALVKCVYVYTIFMMPVYCATRLSIIALYIRLFNGRIVRAFSYICGLLMAMQWIAGQTVSIFPCTPIHQYWDRTPGGGFCINGDAFFRGLSYPTLALDVFLIILPLPTIWTLHVSKLRKAAISSLFLTSILAFIASAYRTKVVQTHSSSYLTPAQTNEWLALMIVETGMYIIVACLPTLAPLFRACLPSSLQRASRRQVEQMRFQQGAVGPREHGDDAVRLVNSDAAGHATADVNLSTKSDARNLPTIELTERATTPNGGLRASDLRGMQTGAGVLVHTEIIVTQEDKIAEVLGI